MMNNKDSKVAKIIPQNGCVLCKQVVANVEEVENRGLVYVSENVPIYEVLKISNPPSLVGISDELNLKVGDLIVCNSIGTKVQVNDSEVLWLFKQENIAAKIKIN
jgi:hypothetical protein